MRDDRATEPSILCVVHHTHEDVGLVGAQLRARGYRTTIRHPLDGDPLPALETVDAAIVFGGAMSSNDEHLPGVRAELDWIDAALRRETPLLGICLGGQMIARVLGAHVGPREDALWEIGYRELVPTSAGDALFEDSRHFFQWHGEAFALPRGAEALATSADCPHQAFRYGATVYGLQFHPEVSLQQLQGWHADFAQDMRKPGGDPIARQIEDDARYRLGVERWLDGFLTQWLARATV